MYDILVVFVIQFYNFFSKDDFVLSTIFYSCHFGNKVSMSILLFHSFIISLHDSRMRFLSNLNPLTMSYLAIFLYKNVNLMSFQNKLFQFET